MASRWLCAGTLGAGVAALAYWRRALTLDGALAAALVGSATFGRGGWPAAGALLAFFGSSSALSRVGEGRKHALPLTQAKGAQRDAWQVLANGGVATLCVLAGKPSGLVGALAAASADTWATEVGLLSTATPRLITTLRRVPAGTSGAVTPHGLLASVGGALVVGLAYAALEAWPASRYAAEGTVGRMTVAQAGWSSVRRALLGGICGALVDSVLGATLQAAYWCACCETPTEDAVHARCGRRTERRRGLAWMTNDTVNALATLSGAAIALV